MFPLNNFNRFISHSPIKLFLILPCLIITVIQNWLINPVLDVPDRWIPPNQCSHLISRQFTASNIPNPFAIQIFRYCRFGNNVYQLAYALITSQYLNIHHIFIPSDFLFLNRTFNTTEGVQIHVGVNSWFGDTIYDNFLYEF
jgi:hypothetical protein